MAGPNLVRLKPRQRSRVGNGATLWIDEAAVDGRSRSARRFRDILSEIADDLGGAETLTEGQRQISRRVAMLCVEAERYEAQAIAGEKFDCEAYGVITDRIGRAFTRLGLKRVTRDRAPTIDEIAARYRKEPAKPSGATKPPTGAPLALKPESRTQTPVLAQDGGIIEREAADEHASLNS